MPTYHWKMFYSFFLMIHFFRSELRRLEEQLATLKSQFQEMTEKKEQVIEKNMKSIKIDFEKNEH